jgi:hypothetical protein
MKRQLFLLLLSLCSIVSSQKAIAQVRYAPTYTYEPKTREQVANTKIVIAVISPFFDGINTSSLLDEFKQFQKAMEGEIEELLVAKGYKTLGPFKTKDEMVFNDKKSSDFTLVVEIEWNGRLTRKLKKIFGPGQFKTKKGELSVSRAISLTAFSNFSGEKLWKKRLTLDPISITWEGTKDLGKDAQNLSFWEEYKIDPALSEPLGKSLETTFVDVLDILWKQFDISEVRAITEQAKLERSNDRREKN